MNLELREQGRFFINGWRQSLASSWWEQEINARFKQKIGANLYLSAGLNLFHRVSWNHRLTPERKLEKSVRSKHTNFGPVLVVTFRPSPTLELLFLGNIAVVHSSGKSRVQVNNLNLDLNWSL